MYIFILHHKNESVCICKEGWCVGLGQEGGCLCDGGGSCHKRG